MATPKRPAGLAMLLTAVLLGLGVAAFAPDANPGQPAGESLSWEAAQGPAEGRVANVSAYEYLGIPQVGGYAMGALPLVPLSSTPEGLLVGEPVAEGAGVNRDVLSWLRYCGNEHNSGLTEGGAEDDLLRYVTPSSLEGSEALGWYAGREGEPLRAGDLPEGGFAYATWRSGGTDAENATILLVMRVGEGAAGSSFAHEGVVAFSARSTFFCNLVVPRAGAGPIGDALAERVPGYEDDPLLVMDLAHSGYWDPRLLVRDVMVPPGTFQHRAPPDSSGADL